MEHTSSYMQVLEESLRKKTQVLQALLELSGQQTQLAEAEDFDMEEFTRLMERKDALLEQLQALDSGFQKIYEGVKAELDKHRTQYTEQIRKLQIQIRKVTDLGVELQALEERNRAKLEQRFARQQQELRQVKTSNKVANTYYKNMAKLQNMDSYFLDQKK